MADTKIKEWRPVLALFIAWGALIFWISPHPPMVDFPQHAAQISLLKDLITGKSPWSEQLQVNFVTPYLIGYGLASLLSFVMPIVVAMKLLLSLAYIGFVCIGIKIRKSLNSDPALDWIFVPTYFGLCYSWGLMTFLLAAPVCLYFIWQADKYSKAPSLRQGGILVLTGLVLLVSHGMTFVLGWGIGLLLLAVRVLRSVRSLKHFLPYALLLCIAYIFYKTGKELDATLIQNTSSTVFGSGPFKRFKEALQYPFAFGFEIKSHDDLIPVVLAIGLAPFLLRLKINFRNPSAWVPFFSVCLLFFVLPDTADNTSLLYQRFSLFLLPTFVWLFSRTQGEAGSFLPAKGVGARLAQPMLVAACIYILGSASYKAWHFGEETREFDQQVRKLEPGQRAVGLIFDSGSVPTDNSVVYIHYTAWYQAERHGLSDFNFAWYTPQIVRYRAGYSPPTTIGFEWKPSSFNWSKHNGDNYRYFFVRGKHSAEKLFTGAPCMPQPMIRNGLWTVYENCLAVRNANTGAGGGSGSATRQAANATAN